jgi:hypothetical protein
VCWLEPSELYETYPQLAEVHQEMRSLYLSFVPLFDRHCLQSVRKQLHDCNEKTEKITVEAINGDAVDFDIWTGKDPPFGITKYIMYELSLLNTHLSDLTKVVSPEYVTSRFNISLLSLGNQVPV